mgnify:CR=1 FL=1
MCAEEVAIIRDPAVAKLLADDTRRRILSLLRYAEMTPQQLAKILGKNVSSITHHLSVLEQGGLVKVVRVSQRGNLLIKWYRATARRFIVSYELAEGLIPGSEDYASTVGERARAAAITLVNAVPQLGDRIDELTELIRKINVLWAEAYERAMEKLPKGVDLCASDMLVKALAALLLRAKPEYNSALDRLYQLIGDFLAQR